LSNQNSNPTVVISQRAAARLRAGHVWVYRSDVKDNAGAPAGSLVQVLDERRNTMGTALYSTSSIIALRLIATSPVAPGAAFAALVRERLRAAVEYRARVVRYSDAYRLVFSEADALPGLIVDRYNDLVSFQVTTQGFDQAAIKAEVVRWLAENVSPAAIIERVDERIRELEQLLPLQTQVVFSAGPTPPTSTTFTMNGVRFHYDALGGQKTGAYLDQRENYAAAEQYAHGEALDVFCYHGGFALHLARACAQVTAVDSSRPALEVAERNEALNAESRRGPEIEWIEANAFDLLRDYANASRRYDTVVLDPPAFAKSQRNLETALRGYKELNLRALKMLRPGGILVTCTCSHHVSEADFLEMLASAAADSHRTLRVLEKRGAAKDHPTVISIPETAYLKCVICYVV
jgi:23S rRNA (cytosine1962-C5)-methyltransferase